MTISAENKLRQEVKTLVREIDQKYWALGRILYEVYGNPNGHRAMMSGTGAKAERKALFQKWGYKNFGEYCEMEVGLRKRTGENLRFAYYYFAIKQQVPSGVIDQLIYLGRSKVYLLAGFATKSNIAIWIKKAKDMTFEDLKIAISAAKATDDPKPAKLATRRNARNDVQVLAKYLCDMESAIRRAGKKIPPEIQNILQWYQENAGIKATMKLVA